jgi:RecA-family ATPase
MADQIYWAPFRYDTILHPATASTSAAIPGPDETRLREDLFRNPPKSPEFIVKGFLPIAPGIRVGAGGTSKTTLNQFEHIHIVLGLNLYGLPIEKPGAVLSVTKEDERRDYEFRYHRIISSMRRNLSDLQIRQFLANAYVMDLTGTDERLVKIQDGNLLMTDLADRIINKFRGMGLALIDIDPMIFFGPGERIINDGEAHLMQVAWLLCRELECCVRLTHHISKAAFRDGIVDQYAGRGGSAGADNARFVHLLMRHARSDTRRSQNTYVAPPTIPTYAIEQGAVLRLHVEKMSGAPRIQEPIWVERDHWMFRHHETPSPMAQRQALEDALKLQEQQDAAKLVAFIGTELQIGIKHSTRSLVSRCSAIGISKTRVQRAIEVAEASRLIAPTQLPTHERRGSKSYFFDLPNAAAATPEPQKPAPRPRRSRSAVTKK